MMVLFILVDLTVPDKIRPRMEMLPVKGHFLSMYVPISSSVVSILVSSSNAFATFTAQQGNLQHEIICLDVADFPQPLLKAASALLAHFFSCDMFPNKVRL